MFSFSKIRKDLIASFVVFLIALPLSLGIAVASGATAQAGIVAAIIGGIIVGTLGGAPFQVSGPAAGLTVLVFGFIHTFGFSLTCVIVAVAGIGQIILGLLKVSRLSLMVAPAVIHGMLAGIGILIAIAQFHVLLGHTPYSSGPLNLIHIIDSWEHVLWPPLLLGSLTVAIIVIWKKGLPRLNAVIPGSLIAVFVATFLAQTLNLDVQRVQMDASSSLFQFQMIWPTLQQIPQVLMSAVVLLLVASAESLLCAIATDRLHSGPRANLDKELLAQGVGNLASGLLGGLPITGVIVRSAANISSGAQSKFSAILHSVWILIFILLAKNYISMIPLSVLAGLLIYVGIQLIKIDQIKHLQRYGDTPVYFITLIGVVLLGLLNGILVGLGVTLFKLLKNFSNIEFETKKSGDHDKYEVTIKGALTFLAAPNLSNYLSSLPQGKSIHFSFELTHIDLTGLEIIRDWKAQYEKTGGHVTKPNLDQWIIK